MLLDWDIEINDLAKSIHDDNVAKGFWPDHRVDRNVGEALMLCVSEISEAYEAVLLNSQDDKLPRWHGMYVEVADCFIRVLDLMHGFGANVEDCIRVRDRGYIGDFDAAEKDFMTIIGYLSDALEEHRKRKTAKVFNSVLSTVHDIPAWFLSLGVVLNLLEAVAVKYGFDLYRITMEKLAFNRGRPFQHGKAY